MSGGETVPEGLRASGVTVRFGGVTAVDGAALAAPPATVTGLVGPTGAGKTTLCDVICGLRRPAGGVVRLDGADLTGVPARRRARDGMARTFHEPSLHRALTVRDNVRAAALLHAMAGPVAGRTARDRWARRRAAGRRAGEVADRLLARVGIAGYAADRAGTVPPGVARLAELARALASGPRLLLLDGPWEELPEPAARSLEVLLRDLAAEGLAVLLAEDDLEAVVGVCDVLYALDAGRVIASGPPAEVRADPRVRAAYGRPAAARR
ncbi:ABC transporter ATP-binding protein [Spirillospora sp. CA-253888]